MEWRLGFISFEELMAVKHIIALPIIISWFIWKARNQSCFNDITPITCFLSSFCLGLLNSYPMDNSVLNIRNVVEENIDTSSPWGYFDG